MQPHAEALAGVDHLLGELHGGGQSRTLHEVGHGVVGDEHEVVLEGGGQLRSEERRLAPLLAVQVHDHAGGVLVHPSEGRAAEHLISGADRADAVLLAAGPDAGGDDLLDDVEGATGDVGLVGGGDLAREQRRAVGHQPAGLAHRTEEGRQLLEQRGGIQLLARL